MCPFNFSHIKKSISEKNISPKWIFLYSNKVVYYKLCSLFASALKDTDFQRLMQIFKRTIHNIFSIFFSFAKIENYHIYSK